MHHVGCLISCRGRQEQLEWLKRRQRELGASKNSDGLPGKLCWEHILPKSNKCTNVSFPSRSHLAFRKKREAKLLSPQLERASIWQEGCQNQLHPVCAPPTIMLPRTSFSLALCVCVFFPPDFNSGSLTFFCLLLQLWGIIKQGYKCKGK